MGQTEHRPTKREWLKAYMDGLERSRYTGSVEVRLTYCNGEITLVITTVKDDSARVRETR